VPTHTRFNRLLTALAKEKALIESQLATGRVAVTQSVLAAGLPPEYRDLFKVDNPADVILPLQEVMKNLPAASLRTRTDQEEQETGIGFATPFSAKAEEDAKRFGVSGKIAPAPKTTPAAPPPAAEEAAVKEVPVKDVFGKKPAKKAPAKEASAKAAPAKEVPVEKPVVATAPAIKPVETQSRTPLQAVFETDEILDDKAVVAHVNKLSGVKGCALMFGDGLSLAGSLPPEYGTEGLCAMAPSLMQRIEKHMVETKLGPLRGMTLSCTKSSVTFFMHDNLCLAALHANAELTSEVQEKLARVVHELSQKYSQAV